MRRLPEYVGSVQPLLLSRYGFQGIPSSGEIRDATHPGVLFEAGSDSSREIRESHSPSKVK